MASFNPAVTERSAAEKNLRKILWCVQGPMSIFHSAEAILARHFQKPPGDSGTGDEAREQRCASRCRFAAKLQTFQDPAATFPAVNIKSRRERQVERRQESLTDCAHVAPLWELNGVSVQKGAECVHTLVISSETKLIGSVASHARWRGCTAQFNLRRGSERDPSPSEERHRRCGGPIGWGGGDKAAEGGCSSQSQAAPPPNEVPERCRGSSLAPSLLPTQTAWLPPQPCRDGGGPSPPRSCFVLLSPPTSSHV